MVVAGQGDDEHVLAADCVDHDDEEIAALICDSATRIDSADQSAGVDRDTLLQGPCVLHLPDPSVDSPKAGPASDRGSDSVFEAALSDELGSDSRLCCFRYCPSLIRIAISPLGKAQAKLMMKRLVPIILFFLLTHMARFQTILLTGRLLGALELDAVALAVSFTNVGGLSLLIGLSTAVETLCSQAFGSVNKKRVGIVLQQGLAIMTLVNLPLSIIFFNTERVLLWFGQDPEVARLAGVFAKYNYFSQFTYSLYVLASRYLMCQGIMYPCVLFGLIGNIVVFTFNFICVKYLHLGIEGIAIGYLAGNVALPIVPWLYIWRKKIYVESWDGLRWESLYGWNMFGQLAMSGLLMVCIEWWTYEIVLIASGALGDLQIAVSVVLFQFMSLSFMLPLSGGTAASILVGNALGAGKPRVARATAYAGLCLLFVAGTMVMTLFLLTRHVSPYIFTSCKSVVDEYASLIGALFAMLLVDYLKGIYSGILRGTGRQRAGAVMNLVSYYVVAMPISLPLAFCTGAGVIGLWTGMLVGTTVQLFIALVIMYRLDWDEESLKAQRRVGVTHPVLLEFTNKPKPRTGAVSLVAFHRLPQDTDSGFLSTVDSTAISVDSSHGDDNGSLDNSSMHGDQEDRQSLSPDPDTDMDTLLEGSSQSSGAQVQRYRGRPGRRIIANRLIFLSISVILFLAGIMLHVMIPIDRSASSYSKASCPGDVFNSTGNTSTTAPASLLTNSSSSIADELDFAAGARSSWRERYFMPETRYRIVSPVS